MYRSLTQAFSILMILLGLLILIRTLTAGFGIGVILGVLFVAGGVGRLVISRRRA
jgi:uncharacterized membrane protein HdeD (DUF308 family)